MYQIKCDGYVLYDPREEKLVVNNPKCKLEVNTVGEASFQIYATHPFYKHLQKMRSVFEILQDGDTIFRGRMTDESIDFNNSKSVDLEGVMGYFNDSIIRPFKFPDDFTSDPGYIAAEASGNVVAFFLNWIINQHNSQVQGFQRFKIGKVTVTDPNNYISKSSEDYMKTWEVIKTRLFDSSLSGFFCIRYEDDGNYIDYLDDFELVNTQKIKFGENLLDLSSESDASETYSALIPLGKKRNEIDTDSDDQSRLTIESLADGEVTEDIVKKGDTIYSKSAVERFGFIYAPPSESTWEDITEARNLKTKGTQYLIQRAMKFMNTITIKALDLHFSDEEIESFRIYRYIDVKSKPHNTEESYRLTQLDIDIQNPQNTIITLGDTTLSFTDMNSQNKQSVVEKIKNVDRTNDVNLIKKLVDENTKEIKKIADKMYPVGSIYFSVNPENPTDLFGGKWVKWAAGRVPVGVDSSDVNFNDVEKTGGQTEHTLSVEEIPSHDHKIPALSGTTEGIELLSGRIETQTDSFESHSHKVTISESVTGKVGSNKAHNNLQPYITCYMWKRIA